MIFTFDHEESNKEDVVHVVQRKKVGKEQAMKGPNINGNATQDNQSSSEQPANDSTKKWFDLSNDRNNLTQMQMDFMEEQTTVLTHRIETLMMAVESCLRDESLVPRNFQKTSWLLMLVLLGFIVSFQVIIT